MKRARLFLVLFALAALVPVLSEAALQTQRAQIQVAISIVVTNPLGMRAPHRIADSHSGDRSRPSSP